LSLITYEAIREAQRAEQAERLQKLPDGFFDAVKNWIDYKRGKGDELSLREVESAKKLVEDVINRRQRKLLVHAIAFVRGDLPPESLDEDEKEFFETAVSLVKEFRERMSDKILTDDGMVQKRLSEVSEIVETIGKREEDRGTSENAGRPKVVDSVGEAHATTEETLPEAVTSPEPLVTDTEPVSQETQSNDLLMGPGGAVKTEAEKPKDGLKLLVDLPKFVGGDLSSYGPFKAGEIISVPGDIKNLLLGRKVAEELN